MKRLFYLLIVPLVLCILLAGPLHATSAPAAPLNQASTPEATPAADDIYQRIEAIKSGWTATRASFNADDGQWDTTSGETDKRFYDTGTYHLRVDDTQTVAWSQGELDAADFYLEVTTFPVDGPANNEFGVVFRMVDNDNFYLFTISSDGYYRLRKLANNEWDSLVDWTATTAIDTGEKAANIVGVLAEGSQISLLVNGSLLTTVDDPDFAQGSLAVAVSTLDEGGVEMAFEDFTLWQPSGEPIETPVAEPTATATPTPAPTEDPQAVLNRMESVRQADPDYTTDFRRANEDWDTSADDKATIEYADRAYVITVDSTFHATWSVGNATARLDLADMYMEADVTQETGPDEAGYGLLVRFQDDENFYFYGINGLGSFSFWKLVNNEWEVISNWRHSDAIHTAMQDTNRLGILAEGNHFALFANDELLAQVVDDTFDAGNVGVYVEAHEAGGVKVAFDNIDIWKTSAAVVAPTAVATEATVEPATATPEPIDVAAIQARVDEITAGAASATDDFRRDTGAWKLGDDEDATIEYANRALDIQVKQPFWLTWSDGNLTLADLLLEVDVTPVSIETSGEFGLIFRKVDDQNYYYYGVNPSGKIGLWKKVDNEWHELLDWVGTDAAITAEGDIRRLGVLAEGPTISLLLDGTPIAQIEDSEFSSGGIGLVVGTSEDPMYAAEFDNLAAWDVSQ